jgi:hypothetical protein
LEYLLFWFCLPKSAAIDDKTVEGPGLANILSISERLRTVARDEAGLERGTIFKTHTQGFALGYKYFAAMRLPRPGKRGSALPD